MLVVRLKPVALALGIAALLTTPAAAELPPQYTVWQGFSAITSQGEIPEKLGVVDRIERTSEGFRVHGGTCWIDAHVVREAPAGRDGRPMVGPSRIVGVKLGEKTCK